LIDTNNLTDKDKVTEHDEKAFEYLKSKLNGDGQFDQTAFFEKIQHAKQDIGSLKLHDVLRKDYKQWDANGKKLGIASVVKPIEWLVPKATAERPKLSTEYLKTIIPGLAGGNSADAFLASVKQFAKDRDLDIVAVMTTSTNKDGKFCRELLVWALSPEAVSAAKQFEDENAKKLGLETWDVPISMELTTDNERRRVWLQKAKQYSRKQVAPMLRGSME
jgi:exopolyphosphatase